MTEPVHLACLYISERPELRRFLWRMTGSVSMAEELVQDAFLRLLERGDRADPVRNPQAYLRRSARNLALNALQAQRRHEPASEVPELADPTPGVVDRMISRQELLAVMRAIAGLPPRRREVFVLSRVDNRSYDEIAERLGISRNTVMVQIVRALSDLRKALEG